MRITIFEGLRPKHSARSIPPKGAQTANNLMPNTGEFRPFGQDTTVIASTGGASGPLTIFRLQRNADGTLSTNFADTSKWRIHAKDVSYVKVPSTSDTTDRHAYTVNDGSEPPRVVDASGDDRQLGVPTPSTAPTVTLNEVAEFTVEDRTTELAAARQQAVDAVVNNVTLVWRGAARPGTTTTGYVDRETAYGFSEVDPTHQVRVYRLTEAGGAVSDPYVAGASASDFTWVFDPALQPFYGTSTGTPAWGGTSQPHICIAYPAYGETYDVNDAAMTAALAAIPMPGKDDGTKLLTSEQVDEIVAGATALVDVGGTRVKPLVDGLATAVHGLKQLIDGGPRSSLAAATEAFYSKTDVSDTFSTEINNFAKSVFKAASNTVRSSLPADYIGSGAA